MIFLQNLSKIFRPIYKEWQFFLIFVFLISQTAFKSIIRMSGSDFRMALSYLCLSFFIGYIATLIIYLSKSKIVKTLFYVIGVILFAVYLFLWLVFGTSLSPTIIQILGETNARETSEFIHVFLLSSRGLASIIIVLLIIALIVLSERKARPLKLGVRISILINSILIIMLAVGAYKSHIYYTLLRTSNTKELSEWALDNNPYFPMDIITTLVYSVHGTEAVKKDICMARNKTEEVYRSSVITYPADSTLTVVYILGESYIKQHAGIYGYYLPTTPNMSKEQAKGNLFAFTDAMSVYNSTTQAEKNTFSLNSIGDGQYWYDCPIFPTVFKRAGFNVFIWDLQRTFDENAVFTFTVNAFLYDDTISKLSYTETNEKSFTYDGDMVDDFFKSHKQQNKRNLLVFHFIGQHADARIRYPHDGRFDRFSIKDIKRHESWMTDDMRQDIAWYDNATYYNDWVIGKIINKIKNLNAVMVYISDHGEEIYDYRPSKGRSVSPMSHELQQHQFAIPMVVWCSDKYMKMHPKVVDAIRNATNRPMESDNIGQMLLHFAGIKTVYYNSKHDILSPNYKQGIRYIDGNIQYR